MNPDVGAPKVLPTASHWGSFEVTVVDGRIVEVAGRLDDPNPSAIARGQVDGVDSPVRIRRPAVRRGFLENGPRRHDERRGTEPFVEVPWDDALDLVASEMRRVRDEFGNEAIYGGS